MSVRLPQTFYARKSRVVAQALLGRRLVRLYNGRRLSGIIVETEAYCDGDEPDLACHGDRANNGQPTKRTAVIFHEAGFAYVYFNYGIHWMFNVVTGATGTASAVLIRALEPEEGGDMMQELRNGRSCKDWTNGPAKLAQALAIDKTQNEANLCDPNGVIWLEEAREIAPSSICTGPRVGLGKTPEPWFSIPWRYWIDGNPFVSK